MRLEQPAGPFDLVLCRNSAFTYFGESEQRAVVAAMAERLRGNGFLVIGKHESVPSGACFLPSGAASAVYRKSV